jgi:hypothetical protein
MDNNVVIGTISIHRFNPALKIKTAPRSRKWNLSAEKYSSSLKDPPVCSTWLERSDPLRWTTLRSQSNLGHLQRTSAALSKPYNQDLDRSEQVRVELRDYRTQTSASFDKIVNGVSINTSGAATCLKSTQIFTNCFAREVFFEMVAGFKAHGLKTLREQDAFAIRNCVKNLADHQAEVE